MLASDQKRACVMKNSDCVTGKANKRSTTGGSRRRWVAVVAVAGSAAGLAAAGIAGATSSSISTSPPLVTAPANSPAPVSPVDSSALPAQVQRSFPSSPAPGASDLNKSQAETVARRLGDTPNSSVHTGAPVSAPAWSELTSYGIATQQLGDGGNALVPTSTPVWLVTVNSPMTTDGGPGMPGSTKSSYTAILDAATGQSIDLCIGCATLEPTASTS